jgi:hypothetical protein
MANDHYVPQFYLRNFEIPTRHRWIFEYRHQQQPQAHAIRSVASIENYYTINTALNDAERNQIDQVFQQLETGASRIIAHFLTSSNAWLGRDDKEVMSMFVSFLAFRTPRARAQVMRMDADLRIQILRILASHPDFIRQEAERIGIDPNEAEAARRAVLENSDDFYIEYGNGADDFFLGTALEIADRVTPLLLGKQWNLLESDKGSFITSDHPVVLVRPEYCPKFIPIGFDQARVIFPLSPRRCLLLSNEFVPKRYRRQYLLDRLLHPLRTFGPERRRIININEAEVSAINGLVILQAHESVFSHQLAAELEAVVG